MNFQAPAAPPKPGQRAEPMPRFNATGQRGQALFLPLVLLSTFVAYVGTLQFGFVYDDHEQIATNYRLRSWQYLPGYFTQHVWAQLYPRTPINFYRPLFLLWLRINDVLFGLRPWGWHLTAVLAHVVVTLLVYRLARRLFENLSCAIAATVVFGLHPIHLEAVAWISGVEEPLAAIAVIGSLLCYMNWRGSEAQNRGGRAWRAGALALYAVGLLTKETAIVLPALVVAWEFIFARRPGSAGARASPARRAVSALAAAWTFLALTGLYLGVRWLVLKHISHAFTSLPLSTLVWTAPGIVAFYFRLLVWPSGLSEFYNTPYIATPGVKTFLLPAAIVVAVVVALAVWSWRNRRVAFASVWLALPILLVLNIRIFRDGDFVHDRYLYLPSVGFALLVAEALRHLRLGRRRWSASPALAGSTIGVLAMALGFGTISQSVIWANDILLGTQALKVAPNNVYALNLLAVHLQNRGYSERAIELQERALRLSPAFWDSRYNLALAYYQLGQYGRAEQYLKEAIQIYPNDAREYDFLGAIRFKQHRLLEAESLIRYAASLEPDDPAYHESLGKVLAAEGDLAGALREFEIARAKDPASASARALIARIKLEMSRETHHPSSPPSRLLK